MSVQVMYQDHSGFLWLGTAEGVYKFDGKMALPETLSQGFAVKDVSAIYVDPMETLWLGTKRGLVYRKFKDKRVDSLLSGKESNTSKITSIVEDQGRICIGTYGNGLYILKQNEISHFTSSNGLSDDVIYKICGDGNNTIWCGTDAGITQLKGLDGTPSFQIISNKNGLPDNIVRDLNFSNSLLLVAMQDSGVCYYNTRKNKIEKAVFFSNWTLGAVMNVMQVNRSKQIIATEKNGIIQFDNGILNKYNYDDYLQVGSVNQVLVDNTMQIWVASNKGLSQLTEKRFHLVDAEEGLEDDKVLALAIDNDNAIWIGTTKGISRIQSDESGKLQFTKVQELEKYTISCATTAPDGNIWFGTYGNGIIILSSETKNNIIINSAEDKLPNDNISNIYFADDHTVYISTLGGGLVKARVELSGKLKVFEIIKTFTEEDGLGNSYVYSSITNKQGQLFIATDGGGLQVYRNGQFENLTKTFRFESSSIYNLCIDKQNNIWATSNANGVLRYNGKTLSAFGQKEGIRDLQPQQLIAVDDYIYAFNSRGIDKINCNTGEVSYADILETDLEPNLNAVYFHKNKIYSGTGKGLLIYRTSRERSDSIKPTVYIKSLQVNYKPFPLDSVFEFSYKQNNISIGFDGIWLKNPYKLVYRYRLNGLEENWVMVDEGKVVNYNNLDPGNYTFIVQVKNEEDVWSEPQGYAFIISTPIWKRWWFWVLTLAGTITGIYLFLHYRLKALQRENLILEKKVAERTEHIARQSRIIEEKNKELEQLSLVASKTDNVVLIMDADGRLEYVNESFVRLNQMDMEEMKEKFGETIFEWSNNDNIQDIVKEAIQGRKSVSYESLNRKISTGQETWEASTLTPIFDEDGHLKKLIIIDSDVTERKRQEQIIVQKNKDITDSISYARKIQQAILPPQDLIKKHLPQSFVLYLTKDIVSGDFYWFSHFETFSIIAAVDCTGHGVPGAFMSLIGYNILNRVVNENKVTDPKDILLQLNTGVLNVLHKNQSESKDGMDIAICKINHTQNTLEYAGAMRPLWVVQDGKLEEVRADKIPIGTKPHDRVEEISYTTHTIPLEKGKTFYIFTDGYADQFGGEKDKKFSTGKFKDLLIANAELPFEQQEQNIREAHLAWKGENEQVDDILLIGFTL